jgi:hypothetical protein
MQPITLDLPHNLGKAAVRARLEEEMAKVVQGIPGVAQVAHQWNGDTLNLTLAALGQRAVCRITVFEDKVHTEIELPQIFALFGNKIREVFGREMPKLLN